MLRPAAYSNANISNLLLRFVIHAEIRNFICFICNDYVDASCVRSMEGWPDCQDFH
jgi:hypothetical protein